MTSGVLENVDVSEQAESVELVSAGTTTETPLVSINSDQLRLDNELPKSNHPSPSYVVIAEPQATSQKPSRITRTRATKPASRKPQLLRTSAQLNTQSPNPIEVDEHAHLYTIVNPESSTKNTPKTAVAVDTGSTNASNNAIETVAWHSFKVKPGDTFSTVMEHYGVSATQWREIMRLKQAKKVFSSLRPGKSFDLATTPSGWLEEITYKIDRRRTLRIWHNGLNFTAETIAHQVETRVVSASGTINNSLFADGRAAGLNSRQIMNMAKIFKWQIDFAKDIRNGDRFAVVYEAVFQDNEQIEGGEILAAAFTNRGKQLRAVRYTDPTGETRYYSPSGKQMRKNYLRTPVDFTKISSKFNLKRRHPVLNTIRAHKGVDYAAPSGAKIYAAGDGKLKFVGTQRGYGRTIVIDHGSNQTTLYAHLKSFARGIKKGKRVRQGDVIGYVGQSGLATGPHLHYEFRINGKHRDPLKVTMSASAPINRRYMSDFKRKSKPLLAELDAATTTQLALNQTP